MGVALTADRSKAAAAEKVAAGDVATVMADVGRRARAAARRLALATAEEKNAALTAMAAAIRAAAAAILAANRDDMTEARAAGQTSAFLDRLMLDEARVAAMADAVASIVALADPVGRVTATSIVPTASSSSASPRRSASSASSSKAVRTSRPMPARCA